MVRRNGDVVILRGNQELVQGRIDPILRHCPEQTYITISERCMYDCKFCSVPKFQGKIKTLDQVLAIIEKVKNGGKLTTIAFTSGVATTPEAEIDRVVEYVRAVRKYNVPIGVAVYPTIDSSQRLWPRRRPKSARSRFATWQLLEATWPNIRAAGITGVQSTPV
jgi:biotin synthase-related radical SAM superfamily protein